MAPKNRLEAVISADRSRLQQVAFRMLGSAVHAVKRTSTVFFAALGLSACYSEDWIIVDQRGLPASNFWGKVTDSQGGVLTSVNQYPLNPSGRTQFNVSSGIPVMTELRDLRVTAWADATGTRECLEDCHPLDGDPVIRLSGQNWPFVYEIVFSAAP